MHPLRCRRPPGGFSLPELLAVLGMAVLLANVAWPSYRTTLQRVRRTDALAALQQLQAAQERYRSEHPRYGSLAELELAALSPQGHYTLAVRVPSRYGYEADAAARGAQADDTPCRHLWLVVTGADITWHSGPAPETDNADAANRRCWGH